MGSVHELQPAADALVPATSSSLADSPLPIFGGQQMVKAFEAYRELQRALDRAMPDQIITADGRPFRKKGYWRAIAVAFNLRVEPVADHRDVQGAFKDGRENFGYVVTYRAVAPNGRAVTGDGACYAIEKAKRRGDVDPWNHLPMQASEHNVRSHAHTRAFNRAVSNLVGFGEVSAEEVERDEDDDRAPTTITTPQQKRLFAIATKAGWSKEALQAWLATTHKIRKSSEIFTSQYDGICEALARGPSTPPASREPGDEPPL